MNKTLGELQALREELIRNISREAGNKLKLLLEQKHIYQHVIIDGKSLSRLGLPRCGLRRQMFWWTSRSLTMNTL